MQGRGFAISWCWGGLVLAALLGFLLADARDLLSPSERLAGINLGPWLPLHEIGLADVSWTWRVTPLAAWWGIACGLTACLLGWQTVSDSDALPMGAIGGLMWLAILTLLFAENLLVATIGWCGLSLLTGVWLVWQTGANSAALGVRRFLAVSFLGDMFWLTGVLLVGLSWRTFDFASLESVEFVLEGWKKQPAVCGLAGMCLLVGIVARCGLFPLLAGLPGATGFSGSAIAWVFGLCTGPLTIWIYLRVWPLLSCAPETVALGQGLCLFGALCNAFLATGQADPRRTIVLLASSQYGILISASMVPGLIDLSWIALAAWGTSFAATALLISVAANREAEKQPSLPKRPSVLFALILLTGVFPSSVFWVSAKYLPAANQRISSLREQKPAVESEYDALPATDRLEDRFQPEPMPSLTWCAAWSLWMFCSAFAGWRAWRLQVSADFVQGDSRIPGFFLGALACSAAVAWGLWHRMQDFSLADDWQVLCGLAAAAAGWLCSARICRDPQLAEERFQQLGSWARLTKRELYLNDLIAAAHEGPLRGMARLSETVDWGLHQLVPQVIVDKVIGPVVIAVEELRSQSASFYAGALLLTIGSLLLTWLSLTG